MRAVGVVLVAVAAARLGLGCSEDKCQTPKIIENAWNQRTFANETGPAIQCNVTVICAKQGQGDKRLSPPAGEDPVILDHGSEKWNISQCEGKAKPKPWATGCKVEVSPKPICL